MTPTHRVSVWSAAKMLGYSGDRVGWLVTEDEDIARLAAEYVEKTVSGVSTRSQGAVARALAQIRERPLEAQDMYARAADALQYNRLLAIRHLGPMVEGDSKGMFAWIRGGPDFQAVLDAAGVLMVPGQACGGTADMYRMSLGHTWEVTETAMRAISSFGRLHG